MELDLFDALTRILKKDDDVLYQSLPNCRWRHIFESDFMVCPWSLATWTLHFYVFKLVKYEVPSMNILCYKTLIRRNKGLHMCYLDSLAPNPCFFFFTVN